MRWKKKSFSFLSWNQYRLLWDILFQTKCYISLAVFANSFSGGKSTIEIHSSITKQKLDMKEKEQKSKQNKLQIY